ncbi:MAG: VWA domain-containing protein [Candidatus Lokiarchaeota archaeon]|nr:VWA domain-containing protein [Candidatus Lokiarchaeota archaeon]
MKVPVSIKEYLALMEALDKKLICSSMEFYYVARALLIKDEKFFDSYDLAFAKYFKDKEVPLEISEDLIRTIEEELRQLKFKVPREFYEKVYSIDIEKLKEELRKKMEEQGPEPHKFGDQMIGTRGTSPFGAGGRHPGGIRIGGYGGMHLATKIAQKRKFRNYRSDRILDIRSYQVALKKLRNLTRDSPREELDLDETIDKTCKQFGEIDLVFRKEKKNNLKVLLLMDVGGSMEPFTELVSQLFSAANKSTHFREFKYYYFHNVPYTKLYKDIELESYEQTAEVIKKLDPEFRVIMVGDAAMAPNELSHIYGSIHVWEETYTPGVVWLNRIKEKFKKSVWLNPEIIAGWKPYTRGVIEKIFPMFDLSIDGLEEAIKVLV